MLSKVSAGLQIKSVHSFQSSALNKSADLLLLSFQIPQVLQEGLERRQQ